MSNKTQLQTNNTTLANYIAEINEAKDTVSTLPEAGGGGGGSENVNANEFFKTNTHETIKVKTIGVYIAANILSDNGFPIPIYFTTSSDKNIIKGSTIVVPTMSSGFPVVISPSSAVNLIDTYNGNNVYVFNADCTVAIDD